MTTNGGTTWSIRWTGARTRELCWKISFVNRQIGFVSIENLSGSGGAYFLKTVDGGVTWQEKIFHTDYRDCQGIGFADEQTGWIGGGLFETEATTNGGFYWNPAGFGWNVNRFRFLSPNLGYACGERVYKWTGTATGVTETPEPAKPRLLAQNSPNPFDRTTRIRYRVDAAGPVSLQLYDVQGHELRTLFRGTKTPGDYEVVVDSEGLPSGIYAYRLTTAGGTEARKMWVMR
jgi:hypothetical protein